MTVWGRDASDYDPTVTYSGLSFFTHKATEGTTTVHGQYGPRLAAARAFGVPVLGAYHVVRTPGNGGNGTLAQQLAYWLAYLDAHTPWWRTHANFILQIDGEKWSSGGVVYDAVSPATIKQFAALLVNAGVPGWTVTYASHGQYGDTLTGLVTPLWNANYNGSVNGSYPGDNYAGWAPYSGKTPILAQYTSSPYDKNAYRGSLAQLLALTAQPPGADMPLVPADKALIRQALREELNLGGLSAGQDGALTAAYQAAHTIVHGDATTVSGGGNPGGEPVWLTTALKAALTPVDQARLAADIAAALIASGTNGLTDTDHAAVRADVAAVLAGSHIVPS